MEMIYYVARKSSKLISISDVCQIATAIEASLSFHAPVQDLCKKSWARKSLIKRLSDLQLSTGIAATDPETVRHLVAEAQSPTTNIGSCILWFFAASSELFDERDDEPTHDSSQSQLIEPNV